MTLFPETPHVTALPILTGHTYASQGYRAYRQNGVRDWLLIYTRSGAGRFGYQHGEFVARPGDWVILRPGELHDYGVEPELQCWELVWTHFLPRSHWHELLNWPRDDGGPMRLQVTLSNLVHDAENHLLAAHELASSQDHRSDFRAMHALEAALIALEP